MAIYLVIGLILGCICSSLALDKQRNPVGWFCIGFFLPLIGLILIIVLPNGAGQATPQARGFAQGYPPPPPPGQGYPPPPVVGEGSIAALERLAALRDRGALSPQEFEDKKREILARV